MLRIFTLSATYAAPTLFIVGGLLASGAVLTALGQPAIGWTIYGIGYVGVLAALAAVAGLEQHALGRFGWIAVVMVSAGVVMGVPEMLMVWGLYTETAAVHDLFMPYATTPVVMIGGGVAWTGVLLVGMAMISGGRLPRGAAFLVIVAALLALPFELRIAPQIFWVAALVILFVALAWIGIAAGRRRRPMPRGAGRPQPRSLSATG